MGRPSRLWWGIKGRRVRKLYSAFLLAVSELSSPDLLQLIVERIEGSIPIFFCGHIGVSSLTGAYRRHIFLMPV